MEKRNKDISYAVALTLGGYMIYCFNSKLININQLLELEDIAFITAASNKHKLFHRYESIFTDYDEIYVGYN